MVLHQNLTWHASHSFLLFLLLENRSEYDNEQDASNANNQ